jgi:hypothetical protein
MPKHVLIAPLLRGGKRPAAWDQEGGEEPGQHHGYDREQARCDARDAAAERKRRSHAVHPGETAGDVVPRITPSVWKRSEGGMVRPKAWDVLRWTTKSSFLRCCTGRSAGLAPFGILSTLAARTRSLPGMPGPYDMRFSTSTNSLLGDMAGSRLWTAECAMRRRCATRCWDASVADWAGGVNDQPWATDR